MKELIEIQSKLKAHYLCEPPDKRSFLLPKPAIYKITNPKGQSYIGATSNASKRYGQYSGMSFKGQRKLSESFTTYGKGCHTFEIVEYCDKEKLPERERYWTIEYDSVENGLNLDVPRDENHKLIRSKETLEMIGRANKGKILPQHVKDAIIRAVKGKKQSQEHINKRKLFGEKNPMFGKEGYWKGKKIPEHVRQSLLSVDRTFGKNGRAKKVINVITGEIFDSAKRALPEGMKYSTFKAQLQGKNPNTTSFKYL